MSHQEDQALLKAYITEWRKFFTQCDYLPTPFRILENTLVGKPSALGKKSCGADKDSVVRKVNYSFSCLNICEGCIKKTSGVVMMCKKNIIVTPYVMLIG